MPFATQFAPYSEQKIKALAPAELIELVSKQEHEIVNLRWQVACDLVNFSLRD